MIRPPLPRERRADRPPSVNAWPDVDRPSFAGERVALLLSSGFLCPARVVASVSPSKAKPSPRSLRSLGGRGQLVRAFSRLPARPQAARGPPDCSVSRLPVALRGSRSAYRDAVAAAWLRPAVAKLLRWGGGAPIDAAFCCTPRRLPAASLSSDRAGFAAGIRRAEFACNRTSVIRGPPHRRSLPPCSVGGPVPPAEAAGTGPGPRPPCRGVESLRPPPGSASAGAYDPTTPGKSLT